MKAKILFFFLLASLASQAQFRNTDSLRRYIDKYIRNSAANAFDNLRLNTALKGLANLNDSVGAKVTGGVFRVVDTVYAINDSTIAYRIQGVTRQVAIKGRTGLPPVGVYKILPDANYTITASDRFLVLPKTTAVRTLTLPAASIAIQQEITIFCKSNVNGDWLLSGSFVQSGTATSGTTFTDDFVNSTLGSMQLVHLMRAGTHWFDVSPPSTTPAP